VRPTGAAAAAAAASAPPTPGSLATAFDDGGAAGVPPPPAPWLGPVRLARLPGKGRGVVASAPLPPGALLLVAEPLAIATGPAGADDIEVETLVEHILSDATRLTPRQAAQLRALTDGAPEGGGGADAGDDEVAALFAGGEALGFWDSGMDEDGLWARVGCNSFGDGCGDLPAALARGDAPRASIGLWFRFSFLNHSCEPNAVAYLVADRMVVRAARAVGAGEELTINYLGRGNLRPLAERRAETRDCYGFECGCGRCAAEAGRLAAAGAAAQAAHERIGAALGPRLDAALNGGGGAAAEAEVAAVAGELRGCVAGVEAALDAAGEGDPRARAWLLASAYDALAMLAVIAERAAERGGGGGAAAAAEAEALLGRMAGLLSHVGPASDLHFYLTVKALSTAQVRHGVGSAPASAASAACSAAAAARYGRELPAAARERLVLCGARALEDIQL